MQRFVWMGVLALSLAGRPGLAGETKPQEMVTRHFDVIAGFPEVVDTALPQFLAPGDGTNRSPFVREEDAEPSRLHGARNLKSIFATFGVEWPPGASIKHVPSIGKLVVKNTPENLEKVETVLAELNVVPCQVEVDVLFLGFDRTDIETLARQGTVTLDALMGLRKQGKFRLLAAPKVVAHPGQEATVKGVTEYIYPSEFSVTPITVVSTNAVATNEVPIVLGGLVEPGAFETREVGGLLSVVPDVSPEGQIINLIITPELVGEPSWKNYGATYGNPGRREQDLKMEQPFFRTCTVTTQLAIRDGGTALAGGGMPSEDGKTVVYIFVSARLIDLDGKPLRKK